MPITVLLVDDSAIIRGLMHQALAAAGIAVVGSVGNGALAIDAAKAARPDVIVLDIEMPVMDGITALPHLIAASPKSKIIMASTLTLRNAEISLQALRLGAADTLPKPSSKSGAEAEDFYRELVARVKALAAARAEAEMATPLAHAPLAQVKALAIAASTGGPPALLSLFEQLCGRLAGIPIFITQHMPPTFTTILAEQLGKAGKRRCVEAEDGALAEAGVAYVAPGNWHMAPEKNEAGEIIIHLNQAPPEHFCRPAADPMLRALARAYGKHLMAAVLTGMGHDALEGARAVVGQGGSVVAQDAHSSVVYGMPKAVAEQKLCRAILPIDAMGGYLIQQIEGR